MRRHRHSVASAGQPRRTSVATRIKKQKSQVREDQEADSDGDESESNGEDSDSDGEIVGDHLELIAELGYKVVHLDEFGKVVTQRHWISLNDAEVKRVQFLREDDDGGTLHRLATEGLDFKIVMDGKVGRAPPDEELRPAFVALFDYMSELQEQCSEQQAKLKQLREAVRVFQSIGPTTPDWIKDEEFATQYDLQRKLNKQEKEIARLKERFNEQNRSGEIELEPEQDGVEQDEPQQNDSEQDPAINALREQIKTLDDNNKRLLDQLQTLKAKTADMKIESQATRPPNEPSYAQMCMRNLQQLQQVAEWQSGQQKAQQVYFEWERVKASAREQQSEAARGPDVLTETTPGSQGTIMDKLHELRANAASFAEPRADSDDASHGSGGINTANSNAASRKKKPNPIRPPHALTRGLPKASRSPKELESIPSTQLGRFQKQHLLGDHSEGQPAHEVPETVVLAQAIWDDYAKEPIHFTSRAKLACDAAGLDVNLSPENFVQDDQVYVFVDSMKDWWPVKRGQEEHEPQYLLHRTALELICPHDQEYMKLFLVIADTDLVSDNGETLRPLVRGQIVQCAHSANIKSPMENTDVLLHCVQSQDGNASGWVPAQVLQGLDYACGADASKSLDERCLCERSQPYTWRAIVREGCSAVDGSFSLSVGDYVDLAHEGRPSSNGLLCVKDRRTGLRGYVPGVNLRVLRQPLAENLVNGQELMVELTPKYFPVKSENWIFGEEVPFELAKSQEPSRGWFSRTGLPFSQEAKQAWENNVQGSNPQGFRWADAEARARPFKVMDDLYNEYSDHGRYVTLADHLTAGLGAELPRNPFGPAKGKRRARSLSAFEQRQKRVIKYGPHIGYQPARRLLGDGKLPGRGYDSEPVSDDAKSKVNRTLTYRKVDSDMRVVEASDEVDVHDLDIWQTSGGDIAKYSDKPVTARCKAGSRYARGPDFVRQVNEMRQRSLCRPVPQDASVHSVDAESETQTSWSISIDINDVATSEVEKDRTCGYRLAYGLNSLRGKLKGSDAMCTADDRFELHLGEGKPFRDVLRDGNNKFTVRQIPIEDASDNGPLLPKILRISPVDLDWSQPYLRRGLDTKTGVEMILLLCHRTGDIWECYSEGDIIEIPTPDIQLLPIQQWPTLASVYQDIAEVKMRLADTQPLPTSSTSNSSVPSDRISTSARSSTTPQSAKDQDRPEINEPHPIYQKGEWDVLFPVCEAQSLQDPRVVRVDTDDHVYLRAGHDDDYHVCEVHSTGLHGFIPRRAVDEKEASLPLCVARCDLGLSSNWVIVLKRKSNMLFCGLPDKSKRWFYEEELFLDDDQGQIVSLHRLLLEDMLQVDDLKPVGTARAKKILQEEATTQVGTSEEQTMPEKRSSLDDAAIRNVTSVSEHNHRPNDIEHRTSSTPQLEEAQACPMSPISEDGSLASDRRNRNNPVTESRYIPSTPKEGSEAWGFQHSSDATYSPDHVNANSEEPATTESAGRRSKLAATGDGGVDDDGKLVVPYKDYKEVKDVCSAITLDFGRLLTNMSRLTKPDPIPFRMPPLPSLYLGQ